MASARVLDVYKIVGFEGMIRNSQTPNINNPNQIWTYNSFLNGADKANSEKDHSVNGSKTDDQEKETKKVRKRGSDRIIVLRINGSNCQYSTVFPKI